MCGRLSFGATDHRAAAELLAGAVPGFEVEGLASWLQRADYRPRYNVGPAQVHWLIRGRRGRAILDRGTWGLTLAPRPGEARRSAKLVINARAETVATRPLFRRAFARGRGLIPADGFFEWERRDGQRLPWWVRRESGAALLFAAVFTVDAKVGPRFSIITVPASDELSWLHPRMPAVLDGRDALAWLEGPPEDARALLRSRALALDPVRVSTRFNQVTHDEPPHA